MRVGWRGVACPDAETLAALVDDALPVAARAAVANHAAECEACHALLSALWATAASPTAPAARQEERRAGDRVDRYVIEARLGAGGMGVVYAAHDPELGRKVAIKLVRAGADDERLRREAQALARLAHPNVVAVHDVGTCDGQVFIAMALVEGQNLRRWLATPRPVDAILRHLVAAGRGLAAAHAAGLIHRDLKPDNIFVSATGETLVGDFGLARDAAAPAADDAPLTAPPLASPDLTLTGTVLGTPAYMAPEQATGAATRASDQFSFCVTAWEALHGARPFAGRGMAEILEATIM